MKENILVVVLDSTRYDTYEVANTPNMDAISKPRRVHSFACWTIPSIFGYLMGFPPIGTGRENFIPHAERYNWAPQQLMGQGYSPIWLSTNPITAKLNGLTHAFFQRHWKHFRNPLSGSTLTLIANLRNMVERDIQYPIFAFMLLMETHHPYQWANGSKPLKASDPQGNFDAQVKSIEYVDSLFSAIMSPLIGTGRPTHVIITSDHGELFGPHFTGHDPSSQALIIDFSPALFEIPLVEGIVQP